MNNDQSLWQEHLCQACSFILKVFSMLQPSTEFYLTFTSAFSGTCMLLCDPQTGLLQREYF